MFRNYLKITLRGLIRNRIYSVINIGGLAVGMAVAMLIGLWIFDELSYNKAFPNYPRIARVMQHQTFNGSIVSQSAVPYVIGDELRARFGSDFRYVIMSSWNGPHILSAGDRALSQNGSYLEPDAPRMLSLEILRGTSGGLREPHSILLSESAAEALFGKADPLNKRLRIDNQHDVRVTGVYKDLPARSDFRGLQFIAPWKLFIDNEKWSEKETNPWRNNSFQAFVQIADRADMEQVSAKIRDVKARRVSRDDAAFKPEVFLHPMRKWHLYEEFREGLNTGGQITFVRLFGIIGLFVLLLACINFMNLSTARSEKRAREIGIRKAVGSIRAQLIRQFLTESLFISVVAFALAVLLVELSLPWFNDLSRKNISLEWTNPVFWGIAFVFTVVTGLIAGSYPAFFLSSFEPVSILKGTFRVGRSGSLPRKALVVLQFTVSITLIIGTLVVFRQVHFARDRSLGYSQDNLVGMRIQTPGLVKHYNMLRNEVLASGGAIDMAQSSSPTTGLWAVNNGYEWKGKAPDVQGNLGTVAVSHDFGKTVGLQFVAGRDFSRAYATDSTGIILNESAVKFMGLKNPIGEVVKADGKPFHVIGVVKDLVMGSPYHAPFRTVFMLDYDWAAILHVKLNPRQSPAASLAALEKVFKRLNPGMPFDYWFVSDDYALRFVEMERIGRLATVFAVLAVLISCLGLFGLASFLAEQRVKEVGIRKVLGASVLQLWKLLSTDFVILTLLSTALAAPLAGYLMSSWLETFDYRTGIPWWIYAATGAGALTVTFLTFSYQAFRAARMNPAKTLKTE
jgi:putative ABC transport system permease protein